MEESNHESINMKQKLRKGIIRDVCLISMLVIGLQLCLFLLFTKSTPTSQGILNGHGIILATNRGCNKSFPNPLALNQPQLQDETIICDRSHNNYDWCFLKCPTILNPNTTTFYTIGSLIRNRISISHPLVEKIRPYPRKWENFSMSRVREITLTTSSISYRCQIYHKGPALVFSIGGYTGNFFHDFNDGIIPLYITLNNLFPNQDNVTLVIVDFKDWWYSKYEILLSAFTTNHVINLDNQTATHCFSSVAVGLISHGPMTIQPNQNQQLSFLKLRSLLEMTYSSNCKHVTPQAPLKPGKPRVVFMGRTGNVGRVILNQNQIINAMERAGFEVVLFEPTKFTWLCDAYKLVNESHGMIGVHGAALTHSIFLRPGSILIQIVPIGIEWLADSYFKNLAKSLRFEYIEYKIRAKESSLAEKYGLCHMIVKIPHEYMKGNWSAVDSIYLKGQDVRLCLDRFRKYLVLAYSKAKRFMDING